MEYLSLEQLQSIPLVPAKRARKNWQGIEHSKLMELLLLKMHKQGWTTGIPTLITSRDGADFAGWLTVDIPCVDAPHGQRLAIGIWNSNSMHGPLKLLAGTEGISDNNCCVFASVVIVEKRTHNLDLDSKLDEGLRQWQSKVNDITDIIAQLQKRYLSQEESNRILMNAGRLKMMPFSRISRVDTLYRENNHKTSWTLLQAFSQVVRMNPPLKQMDQLLRFFRILPR